MPGLTLDFLHLHLNHISHSKKYKVTSEANLHVSSNSYLNN